MLAPGPILSDVAQPSSPPMNFFKRKPAVKSPGGASSDRKKVAIVGSGCSGLAAAWALRSTNYEVHIFEKSSTLGGHTNTQPWTHGEKTVGVDTGFIVMNTATYPNFMRFLTEVGVNPVDTEMTFSVSRDHGKFEWSGEGRGIFAQRRNFFSPRHWRMIFDIVRFNLFALDILSEEDDDAKTAVSSSEYPNKPRSSLDDMSIGQYLDREGYSQSFRDDYLIPMTAAVWSTAPDKASLDFPAKTLIRFMWNHHLLSTIAVRPTWKTIVGGSQQYIDAIIESFPAGRLHIHTSCEVANILRPVRDKEGEVTISWINSDSGRIEGDSFCHAVLACHGDEILPLLSKHGEQHSRTSTKPRPTSDPKHSPAPSFSATTGVQSVSQQEFDIFSAFQTTENVCYLHSDLALMPVRRNTWTSWNYLTSSLPPTSSLIKPNTVDQTSKSMKASSTLSSTVSLTYNMNILQHLPTETFGHVLVTMNPLYPPEPSLTQGKFHYRHPLYTSAAIRAQRRLPQIQGTRGVSYAGAWTNYGFHEDGFSSGLRCAIEQLGAELPFDFVDSTYSRGQKPVYGFQDHAARLLISLILFWLRILDTVLGLPGVAIVVAIISHLASTVLDLSEFVGLL
ncbi:FAD/NAD(P)-binding domain-containing protein [Acrodontium crateriforme]|uniref:FAD/NAD(P)-binding domain-containing protein n=1 Tax=Acrodontium crateriforme TaxID=150365 RepID=A0AAQ3RCN2_9PEZI|nr:FAD/NAD(P)-binding domain-containing protein [Acrodontium crateriforme]